MTIEHMKTQVGNQEIIFETGHIARQAHGAITVRSGDTIILAAVVAAPEAKEGIDFFPLTVDYRERTYAAGRIPGGYFKREGRPTEKEILISRLIDRPIRPLFPDNFFCETQVTVTVLSADGENPTDILSMNGASAALMISDVPFHAPIGAVRVGIIEGKLVANPTASELANSDLDLVLAGTKEKVIMIEAGAKEISEDKMKEAIWFGHQEIQKMITIQKELQAKFGKAKRSVKGLEIPQEYFDKVRKTAGDEFQRIFTLNSKEEREAETRKVYQEKVLGQFDVESPDFKEAHVKMIFDEIEKEKVREFILEKGKRPDGRGVREIRKITCEIGVLPRTHGSALFTRGQTQSLCVTTLGTGEDEQRIDSLEGEEWKRFMLHYNFPPFSVGEAKPNRGPGRREIGHGALAERALTPVMPEHPDFPYTVRLVSEILESNGSSSMATVCGGTLSLMDAGVPLKAPVAGIAIGLITGEKKFQVLTDIAGIEDHHGDMDFKAAGTREGLTALQMDLKIAGIDRATMDEAFDHAREARMKILDMIHQVISAPRQELSAYAPRIVTLKINPAKIGELIGPGGKNIRKITEETGAKIDIEDDGTVSVAAVDGKAGDAALERVRALTEEPEIGKIYQGTVRRLVAFGAFCEIMPGTDGLCHVSEVSDGYVKNVADYLKIGDVVPVKVMEIDERGKVNLSIKQAKEGGMPMLPPDVERDPISEISKGRDRGRDGGPRSRPRSRR
ncbi:MAG: polyribonucleotide nucleotidyltransferase [Candidatus Omnitrophica bacterium]|nr:polyribonucleotide nucleotidyltransferase [Candidatus Omnitrophota bacterium]